MARASPVMTRVGDLFRHCEKRSDEAIHVRSVATKLDCFAEPVTGRHFVPTRWLANDVPNYRNVIAAAWTAAVSALPCGASLHNWNGSRLAVGGGSAHLIGVASLTCLDLNPGCEKNEYLVQTLR